MIIVYVTFPNKKSAVKMAKELLQRRLIACANFFPIESVYTWKKKVVQEKEYVALMKTRQAHFPKIVRYIEGVHPYEIPCIEKISARANKKYERWVVGETLP